MGKLFCARSNGLLENSQFIAGRVEMSTEPRVLSNSRVGFRDRV